MLRFLRVNHLAVIDSVEVEFDAGLNVLTGETGAGKSILVEAVGLLLGGRASGDLVRTGEDMASVEAIFESGGDELLVRREITAQGRSRAFVNGTLVTAGSLKELSTRLIELHGQHEHQTLLDASTHLGVLDAFGQLDSLVAPVRVAFDAVRAAADNLSRVREAVANRAARQELLSFQLGELDRAALKAGDPAEDVELTAQRQVLASAERVERLCEESYASLYESDHAVLATLGHVWRRVADLAALDPQFQPHLDARDAIKSQLEDLALLLRRYADGIEASPGRLQQIEERLAQLERLKRKYGPSLGDVVAHRDALRRELEDVQRAEDRIAELEREYSVARDRYLADAKALSKARRQTAVQFARELERLLADLAMERTRYEVRFAEPEGGEDSDVNWTAGGIDVAEFFVSPNPGEDLRPLARIVSGGELSRIMLAIKTLTFRARLTADEDRRRIGAPGSAKRGEGVAVQRLRGVGAPGLIFDEVDAGIGGRVADVVGRRLHALGSAFQVLCITHLPQIAAYADTHVQIDKRIENGRACTTVKRLDVNDRVNELARMLGGEAISDALRASAREMLGERAVRGTSEAKGKGESERAKGETAKGETATTTESTGRTPGKRRTR